MYKKTQKPFNIKKYLLNVNSFYQDIALADTTYGLSLFLNGETQFIEAEERRYHHALGVRPLMKNPRIKRALILGGGDGLLVRSMLERNRSLGITLCELDPAMIKVFTKNSHARRINRNSLRKCRVVIDSAQSFIKKVPNNYFDLVVADFPDYKFGTSELYGYSMVSNMFRVLKSKGLISAYEGGPNSNLASVLTSSFKDVKILPVPLKIMGGINVVSGVK